MDLKLFIEDESVRALFAESLSGSNVRTKRLALLELIKKAMDYGKSNSGEPKTIIKDGIKD